MTTEVYMQVESDATPKTVCWLSSLRAAVGGVAISSSTDKETASQKALAVTQDSD
jgi:hypothetical protein